HWGNSIRPRLRLPPYKRGDRQKCGVPSAECGMKMPHSAFYTPHSKGDGHGDLRAVRWLAGDGELSSDGLQPLAHIVQPVSSGANESEVKPDAVVRDADLEPARLRRQFDLDFRRGGRFYGVVERFFEREEEL